MDLKNNKEDFKKVPMMKREKIYKRIDQERDYQDYKWNNDERLDSVPDEEKSVAEWLYYMEFHLDQAKSDIYYLDKEDALSSVRKIAALAVRCMEIHGCPKREIKDKTDLSSNDYYVSSSTNDVIDSQTEELNANHPKNNCDCNDCKCDKNDK